MTKEKHTAEEPQTKIIEYSQTAAALAHLREKYAGIEYDVATPEGMQLAKAGRKELRGYRTGLEKVRKEIKAEALQRCQLIDGEARRITQELRALEDPIAEQIDAEQRRIDEEREAKIKAEEERVAGIHARIEDIRNSAEPIAWDSPSSDIKAVIAQLEKITVDDSFEEFRPQANDAKEAALARMRQMLKKAEEREEDEARRKAEQEELERRREEEERREGIRTRIAEIRALANLTNATSDGVQIAIDNVELVTIDERFGEFQDDARDAKAMTLTRLRRLHKETVDREQEEARRRAELQEQERKLAEQQKREARRQEVRNQILTIRNLPSSGIGKSAAELSRLLARAEAFGINWHDDDDPALRKEAEDRKSVV